MDTAQWPQGIGVVNKSMESARGAAGAAAAPTSSMLERRGTRPQKEQALNCPRCNSTNTKFCYYNNYSLSQPRYFCKTCRRYWTEGGSLRNVPVGGGSRKNKRPTPPSSSSTSSSNKKLADHHLSNSTPAQGFSDHHHHHHHSPSKINNTHAGQDLNLGYPPFSEYVPYTTSIDNSSNKNPSSSSSTTHHLSAMELLKSTAGFGSRGLNSFPPMAVSDSGASIYSSGFSNLQEYKPAAAAAALNFSLDGFDHGGGYGNLQGVQENSAGGGNACRLLFPFEDLKQQVSSTATHELDHHHQNRGAHHGDSNPAAGYWNGMMGGGSW